jgi:FkbM family methyltransferase
MGLRARVTTKLGKGDRDEARRRAERVRLRAMPPGQPGVTAILGTPVEFLDGPMFVDAYSPIFEREIYRFEPSTAEPRILDCGANIGLATIYWKRLFPNARVVAFEPDPVAFAALCHNLDRLGITDVETLPAAVWSDAGTLTLVHPASDGGRLGSRVVEIDSLVTDEVIDVPAVRLRDRLSEPLDLLKLDIEGAEHDVVHDCADRLHLVDRLFVEYHGFTGVASELTELLQVVAGAGFDVYVEQEHGFADSPFVSRPDNIGMSVQLNLFCYRR